MRRNIITIVTMLIIAVSATFLAAMTQAEAPLPNVTTTLNVLTANGKNVNLTINGNVATDQISDLWFANNEALYNNTDIAFSLTGQNGTVQFMNMTVPKEALLDGTSPIITIDGRLADDSGYIQDKDNFYVWFTAASSSEPISRISVQITFLLTPKFTAIQPALSYWYTIGIIVAALLVASVSILIAYKHQYDKRRLQQQTILI